MTVLAPFLAYPLHPAGWKRPAGSPDYRVTNTFAGPDLVNGGIHRAVDVGNFRKGDAVRSPAACSAMGQRHSDGALGVLYNLGGGWILSLWHLGAVAIPFDRWTQVAQGQVTGVTGNSGALLADGSPMPAHTHIELTRNGAKVDPEPHLPMPERKTEPIDGATAGGMFLDVSEGHTHYWDILWAAEQGYLTAYRGRFSPDAPVTRAQLASVLRRIVKGL